VPDIIRIGACTSKGFTTSLDFFHCFILSVDFEFLFEVAGDFTVTILTGENIIIVFAGFNTMF
jgi:hypothetical protein